MVKLQSMSIAPVCYEAQLHKGQYTCCISDCYIQTCYLESVPMEAAIDISSFQSYLIQISQQQCCHYIHSFTIQ